MNKRALKLGLLLITVVVLGIGIQSEALAAKLDGATLYKDNCSSCHAASALKGATAAEITNAINTIPQMLSKPNLQTLTKAQIRAIASFLKTA